MKRILSIALFLALTAAPAALAGEGATCDKNSKTASADCCPPDCKPGDPRCKDAEKAKECARHADAKKGSDCCKAAATTAAKSKKA